VEAGWGERGADTEDAMKLMEYTYSFIMFGVLVWAFFAVTEPYRPPEPIHAGYGQALGDSSPR
jgi:hypothetical protein